ncbi:MAG: TonB-dependent receptor [Usitatibacter sp.]
MSRSFMPAGACALALLLAPSARAASDADLDEIRSQIRELKANYENRIQALEQRLKEAEAKSATTRAPAPAPMPTASSSSISAFNPAVSVVLQGRYANLSRDPQDFAIAGFAPGGDIGPGRRGFSLGESEIAMYANVDDKFAGNLIASLTPENTVSVEEAYGLWLTAPYGLAPKFGRFFSGLGYLNEQHQHVWDFIDAPLAYQAFLGGQYANDGIQVKWVAPIEHYIELGAELGNGNAFPGSARDKNGTGSGVVFAHTGGDIGDSHNWRVGLSYLRTRAAERDYDIVNFEGTSLPVTFAGTSRLAVADFVWKYAPHGNARETSFKLQGEYLRRYEKGDFTYVRNADPVINALNTAPGYASTQSGWYLQGIYQFMPLWRVGARYDRLDAGSVDYGRANAFLRATDFDPKRYSVMLDYTPSEFSRFRLQFSQGRTMPDVTDNQWFVQYILSLGAHGAHKY